MEIRTVEALIELNEGYREKIYRCTAGKQSIGIGRNLDDRGIRRSEAEFMLKNDIDEAIGFLRLEPYWLSLDEVRQAVLIDMVFNLGWTRFSKFSRLRVALGAGNYSKAAVEMMDSDWYRQVGDRAPRLQDMMITGKWPVTR